MVDWQNTVVHKEGNSFVNKTFKYEINFFLGQGLVGNIDD